MNSGFGTVISGCLKEFSIMVTGTLDDFYPSFFEICGILAILAVSILVQAGILGVLLENYKKYQIISGVLLLNLPTCFILAQMIYGEVILEFKTAVMSLAMAISALILISNERDLNNGEYFQIS